MRVSEKILLRAFPKDAFSTVLIKPLFLKIFHTNFIR